MTNAKFETCRLRRDEPEKVDGKPKNKYMQPKGGPRYLFRPPGAAELFHDANSPIVLVESEKAALALMAWAKRHNVRILVLAMDGCWGWSENKAPLPDLEVCCRNRHVTILLDANEASNAQVAKARSVLTQALLRMSRGVHIASLPQRDGVNGPDDLLATEGDAVLGAARPAEVAPHSDDALAERFYQRHSDDLRYVQGWGEWLFWDGQRWAKDDTQKVASLVQKMCEEAALECESIGAANRVRSARTRAAVQQEASVQGRLAATVDQWDRDPWLLNTPGGVVDLHTGKLRPAVREDYCTKLAGATPEKKSPNRWRQFLDEITAHDKQLQKYLQRICGYFLTGDVSEHAVFFLYGTGANGKSVFVRTIAEILKEYCRVAPMETFMVTHNPTHPTDVAGLRGARLVIATELEDGQRWAEAKLKQITGGEPITARKMRQNFFQFTPQFKPLLSGNYQPRLLNVDEAMRRRLHLIPFCVTVPPNKRDPKLAKALREEWPAILDWAVKGCPHGSAMGITPTGRRKEGHSRLFRGPRHAWGLD
jgi:P4 family phage/plasmid primase-like protien